MSSNRTTTIIESIGTVATATSQTVNGIAAINKIKRNWIKNFFPAYSRCGWRKE